MMKHEFEDRIGHSICDEEYSTIEYSTPGAQRLTKQRARLRSQSFTQTSVCPLLRIWWRELKRWRNLKRN